jgi:hypothetical protein
LAVDFLVERPELTGTADLRTAADRGRSTYDTGVRFDDGATRGTVVVIGATADHRQGGLQCGRRHLTTGLRV